MADFNITNSTDDDIQVYIYAPKKEVMFQVMVAEPVIWTTEQKGAAGKLEFTVVKFTDENNEAGLSFQEGDIVLFKYKGEEVFRGRIFVKQRDKDHHISCIAYDTLRYFKNKINPRVLDMHKGTTTTKILNWLCNTKENAFTKGDGEDAFEETTEIVKWNEVNPQTLFDIIDEAAGQTIVADKKHTIYTLYDKGGKLYYKSQDNMKLDLVIDEECLENFSYTSSIDGETYNRVLLYWGDDEGETTTTKKTTDEKRMPAGQWDEQSDENIEAWGVLQYVEKIDSRSTNYKDRAKKLLEIYNRKTREVTLQGCFGDVRVRAGNSVIIDLNLGDVAPKKYAFVMKARHIFENKFHTMDLDVDIKIPTKGAV